MAAIAVILLALVIAAGRWATRPSPAERAVETLRSTESFDSSREAVAGFAAAYEHLAAATEGLPEGCETDRGRGRCLGLHQAAGWALTFAPAAGQCTQPAIQTGRIALLDYVRVTLALDDDAEDAPEVPPIPGC